MHGTLSNYFDLDCGVRQNFCVGSLLFAAYASNLFAVYNISVGRYDIYPSSSVRNLGA